jgi:alginate O-acetyltransferase complex protein AlgI
MIFASFIFLVWFLPGVLALYYAVPLRVKNLLLTASSFVFYGWWRPDFLWLMLLSCVIDWAVSLRMGDRTEGRPHRKAWLVVSMLTNLGLLAYFKYANLVVEGVNELLLRAGEQPFAWQKVLLPVGISFYTFQSMSYTIDVYRGEVRPVRSLADLACYVTMFPQLVAGPIVRYRDVQNQVTHRTHTLHKISTGVFLFMIGFSKKVLIADSASRIADLVFAGSAPGFVDAWTGVTAYAVQIYFDFSGYSDMAIGLGLLLGFTFPVNFDSPYKSLSITEFWRRWHISLSTWLRDYLYVPLGGNRRGVVRTYVNLMVTMLLGGLWHGASWTFLVWGAYQGFFLVVERLTSKRPLYGFLPHPLRLAVTFVIVLGGWTIFRATTFAQLGQFAVGMLGGNGTGTLPEPVAFAGDAYVAVLTGLGLAFLAPNSQAIARRFEPLTVVAIAFVFVVAFAHLLATKNSPFLYFQF